ncbi:MAG: hypothetical protein JOZ15_04470 [Acidobacteria bacterium]|nr:hypothetical protein [Acidobacteriota bacterium]
MSQTSVWYLIGFVVAVAGLAWLASLAGMPPRWIGASVLVLVGLGIAGAAKKFGARQPGPPPG